MSHLVWIVTGPPSPFISQKVEGLISKNWEVFAITPQAKDYSFLQDHRISKKELNKEWRSISNVFRFVIHFRWVLKTARFFQNSGMHSRFDALKVAMSLLKLLSKQKPDLIHVQWLYESYLFEPLAKKWNVPLLVSIRGSQANYYIDTQKDGRKKFQFQSQFASHFHAVGNEITERLLQNGISQEQVTVVYNGVNRTIFQPLTDPLALDQSIKLLTVGNFNPRKNHLAAISLLAELEKNGLDYTWTFIGSGEDQLKFRYWIQALQLPSNKILFFEDLPLEQMAQQYQKHHFLLSFSSSEGLCNSVLEAMACGCVPVVFNATGMQELIDHQENGIIFNWGDVTGMSEWLAMVSKSPIIFQELQKKAIQKAGSFPNHQESVQQWIDLYLALIGRKI